MTTTTHRERTATMPNIVPTIHHADPDGLGNWVSIWPPILDTPPVIQINTPDAAAAVHFTAAEAPALARAILEAAGLKPSNIAD
jgi:hypothetical protein